MTAPRRSWGRSRAVALVLASSLGLPHGLIVGLPHGLILALPLGLLLAGGCEGDRGSQPEAVARAFATAVRARDSARVLELVDEDTRRSVERNAELATDRVGGRRVISPNELLDVGGVDLTFDVAETQLLDEGEGRARVALEGPDGRRVELELVFEGAWRVRLPGPEGVAPATATGGAESS